MYLVCWPSYINNLWGLLQLIIYDHGRLLALDNKRVSAYPSENISQPHYA